MDMTETLFYVEGRTGRPDWFVAGMVVEDEKVVRAAPILAARKFVGKSMSWVRKYCAAQNWTLTNIQDHPNPPAAWEHIIPGDEP
jgi:hypothetical protein